MAPNTIAIVVRITTNAFKYRFNPVSLSFPFCCDRMVSAALFKPIINESTVNKMVPDTATA
ncbi:hypothetical protein Q4548_16955, partial [Wenyingzhuangia sp. 2_MG-2023]